MIIFYLQLHFGVIYEEKIFYSTNINWVRNAYDIFGYGSGIEIDHTPWLRLAIWKKNENWCKKNPIHLSRNGDKFTYNS